MQLVGGRQARHGAVGDLKAMAGCVVPRSSVLADVIRADQGDAPPRAANNVVCAP